MFLLMVLLLMVFSVSAMDNATITYGVAQENDEQGILDLFEQAGKSGDKRRIVILPPDKCKDAVCESIKKGRFFVAKDGARVVGCKKAYLITDPKERNDILAHELRFIDQKTVTISVRQFVKDQKTVPGPCQKSYQYVPGTYIYDGSDLTDPAFRKRGINSELSKLAFKQLLITCKDELSVALVFGLSNENSGRLGSIARAFAQSIETVHADNEVFLTHYSTRACMPVFNKTGNKLPDAQCIPGAGNMLVYTKRVTNHE